MKTRTCLRLAAILTAGGLMGACATQDIATLRMTESRGDAFNRYLSLEYLEIASYEEEQMYDHVDAARFAKKGLAAVAGKTPAPEILADWFLPAEHESELGQARDHLVKKLDGGARELSPRLAAKAQAKFDCWVEQQEENWQIDHIDACRKGFFTAMAALEVLRRGEREPSSKNHVRLYFDFDSAEISWIGGKLLEVVAAESKERGDQWLMVSGHADRSGSHRYNDRLSAQRARAVETFLARHGLPAEDIEIVAVGERHPLVETRDGVREPENRRVEIRFQGIQSAAVE
jgi:OmpA-OmpF porin, OOP family